MAGRPPCAGAAQVLHRAVWVAWCGRSSWPLARITLWILSSPLQFQLKRQGLRCPGASVCHWEQEAVWSFWGSLCLLRALGIP